MRRIVGGLLIMLVLGLPWASHSGASSSPFQVETIGLPHTRVAASDGSIYPPIAAFMLPASLVGGAIAITRVPTSTFPGSIKPQTRTDYNIKSSPWDYKVDVFRSAADARAAFAYQMAHLSIAHRFLPVSGAPLPDERTYIATRVLATAGVYRNLYLLCFLDTTATPHHPSISAASITRVYTVERALIGAAQVYAARPPTSPTEPPSIAANAGREGAQSLLDPPDWVFSLPVSVAGRPTSMYGAEPHTATYVDGPTVIAAYSWSTQPPASPKSSLASYGVGVLRTSALARTRNHQGEFLAERGCIGNGAGCSTNSPASVPLVARPDGGWVRGACYAGGECAFGAGAAFHNLLFTIEVDCTDAHLHRCGPWTAALLAHLIGRARGYAATAPAHTAFPPAHSAAPSPTPTATPIPTPVVSPQDEDAAIWQVEALLNGELSTFDSMEPQVADGAIAPAYFVGVARAEMSNNAGALFETLNSMPMGGIQAAARQLLDRATSEIDRAWQSVINSGGATADTDAYNTALTDATDAEQLIPLP